MPKPRVLVDTCIIIEAYRTRTWKAICNAFDVETVEKCVEECCTGDVLNPKRISIKQSELQQDLAAIHPVSPLEIISLADSGLNLPGLDDGELHLMAWLYANRPVPIALLFSTADKAALRASGVLGLIDQVASLESFAKTAGVSKTQRDRFEEQFTERWLSSERLSVKLKM